MKNILIAGAGKSSSALIHYMLDKAAIHNWLVTVLDSSLDAINSKTNHHPNAKAVAIDLMAQEARRELVKNADIVLSVMPPELHHLLAEDCLIYEKHIITSSYTSNEIKSLDAQAKAKKLLFMNEMGADPGIDHMSTAKIIHDIEQEGGKIISFRSFCGGLVAPESDNNPWHYKVTWNPHNIVHAGKLGAVWLENTETKKLTYEALYSPQRTVNVDGVEYGYYPNRDSLQYLQYFNLKDIESFERATLRHPNFIKGWSYVIKLNLTDETILYDTNHLTYEEWVLKHNKCATISDLLNKLKLGKATNTYENLLWLGIFDKHVIQLGQKTSAEIMLHLIQSKWKLQDTDKDLLVMYHETTYINKHQEKVQHQSAMNVVGENHIMSAMAKCVGLPMAILAYHILEGNIDTNEINGVKIPTDKVIYETVLPELASLGITFKEKEVNLSENLITL